MSRGMLYDVKLKSKRALPEMTPASPYKSNSRRHCLFGLSKVDYNWETYCPLTCSSTGYISALFLLKSPSHQMEFVTATYEASCPQWECSHECERSSFSIQLSFGGLVEFLPQDFGSVSRHPGFLSALTFLPWGPSLEHSENKLFITVFFSPAHFKHGFETPPPFPSRVVNRCQPLSHLSNKKLWNTFYFLQFP